MNSTVRNNIIYLYEFELYIGELIKYKNKDTQKRKYFYKKKKFFKFILLLFVIG